MSINCLDKKMAFYNKMRSGRLICSFILLISLIISSNSVFAQEVTEVASLSIKLRLLDLDGDNYKDAEFENKDVKLIISSKTGTISFYYLKGEKFEENFYPPQIESLGYSLEESIKKVFSFDTSDNYFADKSFNIEVEKQDES